MRGRLLLLISFFLGGTALPAADDSEPVRVPLAKEPSFKLEKANATRALAHLQRVYGVTVEDRLGHASEPFSIDHYRVAFWPALDEIARATQGRVELYARDGRLALVRRPAAYRDPPRSYSGFFRTSLNSITTSRDLEGGTPTCTARLEVAWEPTLEPLLLETSPQSLTVQDDHGRPLPCRADGSSMAYVDGKLALEFPLSLPVVPRTVPAYRLVEGKLSAVAPSKVLTFTFDTLDRLEAAPAGSAPLRRESDGVSCRLTKVHLTRERWSLQVTVDYPARGVQLESFQSRLVNNEMTLESKDGTRHLAAAGYVLDDGSNRRAVITYHFFEADKGMRAAPADWKVRYRTPAALVEVPLTFSFKDVALP